ncbi:MAG: sensor hybrid histidine kinase [Verrucomicrobiaceae bacterium]|nr:sensor hybrid histidine kinase [Verrucomicrobiaceae bacterium]
MDVGTKHLLALVSGLSQREGRQEAARALAAGLGAEDLMMYIWDESVSSALPAPGFPQTLPGGWRWRDFVGSCGPEATSGILPWQNREVAVVGFQGPCESVLVLLGGAPKVDMVEALIPLLPLLTAAFDRERVAVLAEGSAVLAEQNAQQSKILTSSLEKARQALRKALVDAQSASKAKDRFLATLSHELRTPLTPVLLLAAAIENDPDVSQVIRSDVGTIRRNVELEVRLIDDLLDVSRIVTGKMRMRTEPVDFNRAVRNAIENCQPMIEGGGIVLQKRMCDPLPPIFGDSTRIQQVLWNLVRNAVKFTPKGGTVSVTTESASDGGVSAVVTDSGIGIDPQKLDRIFGAFEQIYSETLLEAGGLGLGLAISKAIVDMHGGSISAYSAGLGKGARFTVVFPAGTGQTVAGLDQERKAVSPDRLTARILLVEDNEDTARALRRLMVRSGHEVTACGSIGCALAELQKQSFDLILSDLGLPDGTGHELMRTAARQYGMPGIAMSGYGTDADLQQSRASGFAEHIVKPVRVELVMAAIQNVLHTRQHLQNENDSEERAPRN